VPRFAPVFCFFAFALTASPIWAALVMDRPAPVMMVEKLHTALLENMRDGQEVGFAGRKEKLAPIVHEVFDLEGMTRASVGAGWQKVPEGERKLLVEAFAGWTIATYASQFKAWDGEQFVTVSHSDPEKIDVMVATQIKPKTGKATALTYRLRQQPRDAGGGPWQVIDVLLDGAVSQLALRRADFAAVFAKGGAPQLTEHLKTLTQRLEALG